MMTRWWHIVYCCTIAALIVAVLFVGSRPMTFIRIDESIRWAGEPQGAVFVFSDYVDQDKRRILMFEKAERGLRLVKKAELEPDQEIRIVVQEREP